MGAAGNPLRAARGGRRLTQSYKTALLHVRETILFHISHSRQQNNAWRSRPVSRILCLTHKCPSGDGHFSGPTVARRLERSTRGEGDTGRVAARPARRRGRTRRLLELAGGGVCPATTVTDRAVRSYRTISPLPTAGRSPPIIGGRLACPRRASTPVPPRPDACDSLAASALRQAVYFLWHFPWHHCRWPLATTVARSSSDFPPRPPLGERSSRQAHFATRLHLRMDVAKLPQADRGVRL